jgi:hypothetical protein
VLTGALIGLVIGVIGAITVAMRQSQSRKKMQADLGARGIAVQPGAAALQMPPTRMIVGVPKPPEWSAAIGGPYLLHIYGYGGFVIAGWRAAVPRPAAFVIAATNGANPDRVRLHKVDKKQLPAKGVNAFSSGPEVTQWLAMSPIIPTFLQRFGKERGWYLVYADGFCYVYSALGAWKGFDDVVATVGMLSAAIA